MQRYPFLSDLTTPLHLKVHAKVHRLDPCVLFVPITMDINLMNMTSIKNYNETGT